MQIKVSADGFAPSTFNLTERESKILGENSIERVINTAIDVANQSNHRNAAVCYDDLIELKPLMVRMWTTTQSANFAGFNKVPAEQVAWTPQMQTTVDWLRKEYGEIYGNQRYDVADVVIWKIYRETILEKGIENYNKLFENIHEARTQ